MNRFRSAFVSTALVSIVAFVPFITAATAHAQKDTKNTKPGAKPAPMAKGAAGPSQTSVASKDKKFATIDATDVKAKAATDAKNLPESLKMVGKTGAFSGTVAKVFEPKGNRMVLINFDHDYKSAITAVVRAANFNKFPDLKMLEGKKVLVSGKVVDYKGNPELVLAALNDIKIIK